ncbi:MAG: PAS domain S-box protein [Alkalispirochaeta sp.]
MSYQVSKMKAPVKTLLLVEDEALIALNEKMQLESIGFSVVHVLTGEAAVSYVLNSDSRPDLVLMDINLGKGIDGTQAAEQILNEIEIPIVFLSSHTEAEVVEKTEKITSYGYVVKNSGLTILDTSIKMAFKLFDAKQHHLESEEKYRRLFESMLTGVIRCSMDGTVTSANSAAKSILGSEQNQIVADVLMGSSRAMIDEQGNELPDAENPLIVALETCRTIGPLERGVFVPEKNDYVWILITATPLFRSGENTPYEVSATIEDITKHKKSEEALKTSEQKYRFLFDNSHDAVFIYGIDETGSPSLNIDVNQRACTMLQYSKDELLNMSMQDIVPEGRSSEMAAHIRELSQVGFITFETESTRRDGITVPVEVSTYHYEDRRNRLVISSVQDLSERKQAEREFLRQISEREVLLREVHHRVKNNLAQIESMLEIQAQFSNNDVVKSELNVALLRIRSIRSVYEKMLIQDGYREISIREYLESLVDSLADVLNAHSKLCVEKEISDFALSTKTAILLGIIVNELLTNSFKHAAEGRSEVYVSIVLDKTDAQVMLTVHDDGIGFESVSTDSSSGFGLNIVRMLVEQLGGTLTIESDNGTKSVVTFEV